MAMYLLLQDSCLGIDFVGYPTCQFQHDRLLHVSVVSQSLLTAVSSPFAPTWTGSDSLTHVDALITGSWSDPSHRALLAS